MGQVLTVPLDSPFQNGKEKAHIQTLTGDTNEPEYLQADLYPLILVQTGVKIYIANTEQ